MMITSTNDQGDQMSYTPEQARILNHVQVKGTFPKTYSTKMAEWIFDSGFAEPVWEDGDVVDCIPTEACKQAAEICGPADLMEIFSFKR
jgi:hypothetical protein